MKKFLTMITILAAALTATAQKATYTIYVQDFCDLTVLDGVRVDYRCDPDSAGWATFNCTPEEAAHIRFTNNAEHLSIRTDAEEEAYSDMPCITVYSSHLVKVANCGDSTLTVYAAVPVKEFHASLMGNGQVIVHNLMAAKADARITSGNGHIVVDGTVGEANMRNVSTGCIDASDLIASAAKCFVLGTGNVHVSASDTLKVYGMGPGIVYYHNLAPDKIKNRGLGVKSLAYSQATQHDKLYTVK